MRHDRSAASGHGDDSRNTDQKQKRTDDTMTPQAPLSFFTICSKNFFAYAHTLHQSVQAHHPGAKFYVAVCDRLDGMKIGRAHV